MSLKISIINLFVSHFNKKNRLSFQIFVYKYLKLKGHFYTNNRVLLNTCLSEWILMFVRIHSDKHVFEVRWHLTGQLLTIIARYLDVTRYLSCDVVTAGEIYSRIVSCPIYNIWFSSPSHPHCCSLPLWVRRAWIRKRYFNSKAQICV